MNLKCNKITTATALLVTLAVAQFYVGSTFAEPNSGPRVNAAATQPLLGILTTTNNAPIIVNGASAISGATIPSGATIETPANAGATIRVAGLGSVCLAPGTIVTFEFDRQGNIGSLKITLTEGCAILTTFKDTTGIVTSAQGAVGQLSPATGGSIDVCLRPGAAPSINQGSAVDAGAGASALDCGAAGAAAAPEGILPAVSVAFIGGGAVGLYLLFRGGTPSSTLP